MQTANFEKELQEIAGESIGWLRLERGTYLHMSRDGKEDRVIITGLPDAELDGENVLLMV